ncbi:hypothetical protein E4665_03770 [Sporolactobacillus shoreae]|uniref:Holliday junction resolvase RecU n=1 Tax=Sporolactobacillus shoreae TaxID=1465501 RepID=A0A4Z0GTA0_9BACL|nr:hypothetical protein E4665_03770 [Sporolactobacillus shoreae]
MRLWLHTLIWVCNWNTRESRSFRRSPTPFEPIRDKRGNFSKLIPAKKSTVDFISCLNGRGLAFDAKRTRFPLANVHEHQVRYLKRYLDWRRLCLRSCGS